MNARRQPIKPLQPTQLAASDPKAHAAVSASAGTGKTQVLTSRVLRLLIQGAAPESLLCLTFTKAAAAEMANRIGQQLASWVRLKDSELGADLLNLGESNDPATRTRARRLFARVLDCPGGLKIQTIHAFAQSLLGAFPAEAGIAPGFEPIEGRAEQELVRRTLADLVSDAEERGDAQLIADVQCLSRRLGEAGAIDYLKICASRAAALQALGEPEDIEPAIRTAMQLPEGSIDDHLALRCSDDGFDCDLLRAIADANRSWDSKEGADHVARIEHWLALPSQERAAALPDLALLVFTKGRDRRKVRQGQVKVDGAYEEHADRLAEAIGELLALQAGAQLASEMAAGLRSGQKFARAYTAAKRSAGVADFNDLIEWTRSLLARPGMGEWVRYKLDRQIDHVLVDEAQDTNAAQWDIIDSLVSEFFTGSSEEDRRWRTLFTVGDFKQAIYAFQGTDPAQFEQARSKYKGLAEALIEAERSADAAEERAREFRDLSIDASFRSAQPILDVVDATIDALGFETIGLRQPPARHVAFHSQRSGKVELWAPFKVEETDEGLAEGEEDWIKLKYRYYADHLAERIQRLVDDAPRLDSTGRNLAPGDILILVRSRSTGDLASLIVARLFARGVPVAGVDRLHLQEPLAVQDLLAAIRFVVQPNDDLSLASLLVSPLIGWDQDMLRRLAYGRGDSLWRALRDRSAEADFAPAHAALSELLRVADFTTPAQFLEIILTGPMQGRRKLYGRLGTASRDPIDELMNSAIEFERNEAALLDRFLAWFSRGDVDVQRDPGAPANEVRVMTVHGAKGLQAPVVILADSTADPKKLGRTPLSMDFPVGTAGTAPLLRPRKEERMFPFAELIEAEEVRDLQEHRRLLYVALTRAADRLIVAGVAPRERKDGADPRPEHCWHRAVQAGMLAAGAVPVGEGENWSLVHGRDSDLRTALPRVTEAGWPEIPPWAVRAAPPEARPPRPLAPSALAEDREAAPPPSPELKAAAERGTIIHALLERLPAVAPDERELAALRWLEHSAGIADSNARKELADMVCGIISDSGFASLFGPGSLGEAPIAATLPDGRVIAGTVDRLLVERDRVLVVDYKTGRVPATSADIPASHLLQMQAYREALAVIFPGRSVESALLYTGSARFYRLAG